jgi:DNA-binding transcriptional LysR family regulator
MKLIIYMIVIRYMNLRTFDLNLIRVLDALLAERSTTLAGRRIGLSQPAVSAALGRLRAALGDPLFVRHGQRLLPTDFARSLELPVRDILDRLEATLSGPAEFNATVSEEVFRISGSDFFAELLMPQLAEKLAARAPGVRVQLLDLVPENYVESLERQSVDLALIPQAEFPEWVDWQPVFHSSFVMIARSGHERLTRAGIGAGETVPIDLFCDLGHVVFSPEGQLRSIGDAALAKVGRVRKVVMTLPVFYGVCRVVAKGDWVALIPRQLAQALGPNLGLSYYRPPMPLRPALICMAWHRRMTNAPSHRWLRSLVGEVMEPLNAGEIPVRAG